MNTLLRLMVALFAAAISGCGVQKEFVKAYDGPPRPSEQIALVKPQPGIIIEAIDGDTGRKMSVSKQFGSVDAEIALTPGKHTFKLNMRKALGSGAVFESTNEIAFTQNLEAGHKYLLTYVEPIYLTWKPILKDVTDHPELWCLTSPRC